MKHKKKASRHHYSSGEEERITKEIARLVRKKLKRKKKSRRHYSDSSSEHSSNRTRSTSRDSHTIKHARYDSSLSPEDGGRSRSHEEVSIQESPDNTPRVNKTSSELATGRHASPGPSGNTAPTSDTALVAAQATTPNLQSVNRLSSTQNAAPLSKDMMNASDSEVHNKDIEEKVTEPVLKEDVLNVIGHRLKEDRSLALPIHSSFAVRWSEVLQLGLPKEEKEELIKKYPVPSNCLFLDPPKLNKEISLSINEICKNRDQRIVAKQSKLQACIGGVAKVLSSLLTRENEIDVPIIESMSDIARLIIDAMHDETSIRRSLILAHINTGMKETLNATEANELLFGKNLSENLKLAKVTGQDAQSLTKKISNLQPPKNQRTPLRQQNRSQTEAGKGHQRLTSKPHTANQSQNRPRSSRPRSPRRNTQRSSYKTPHYSRRRY